VNKRPLLDSIESLSKEDVELGQSNSHITPDEHRTNHILEQVIQDSDLRKKVRVTLRKVGKPDRPGPNAEMSDRAVFHLVEAIRATHGCKLVEAFRLISRDRLSEGSVKTKYFRGKRAARVNG
jgi:hypothetical protein